MPDQVDIIINNNPVLTSVSKTQPFKKQFMAEMYAEEENPWVYTRPQENMHGKLAEHIAPILPSGLKVLDLGCGEGHSAITIFSRFPEKVEKYIGVDIADKAIERAPTRVSRLLPNSEFFCLDYESDESTLPLLVKNSNLIVITDSLYYCHTPLKTLAKLDQWMTPSTILVNGDCLVSHRCRTYAHKVLGHDLLLNMQEFVGLDRSESGRRINYRAYVTRKPEKVVESQGVS